jgi:hypothetical protein
MCQLLISGVGYVPTPNMHLDVWNHVESYTINMLLACRLKITFTFSLKLIIAFFGTTTTLFITVSNSHFFSGQSRHASSSSIMLYLWLGVDRLIQGMMPQRHGWGWYPSQTTSYIHSKHIKKCLRHWYAVSNAYGCPFIPLHRPSFPQIWGFRFTWGGEMIPQRYVWGWYPLQTAAYIHIRHI